MEFIKKAYPDELLFVEFLVNFGFVGDVLGPVGVVEGGKSLLDVDGGGRNGGNDGGFGAPSESVLQQTCQFALSI